MRNKKLVKIVKHLLLKFNLSKVVKRMRQKENYYDHYDKGLGKIFYAKFLTKGDLVFDVGANKGDRVSMFYDLGCKVIAVEPQIDCCNLLEKRFPNNNVIIENIGLGSEVGELEYYEADENVLTTFSKDYIDKVKNKRHDTTVWKKSKKVKIDTLENLVVKYGMPKFCKIDVEGYEYQVLEGMKQNIPYISLEYNVPELQEELTNCIILLTKKEKYVFNYSQGETMVFALDSWLDGKSFLEIIRSPEFIESSWGDIYCQLKD
jgi:FkbM family methyltransferase